MPPFNLVGSPIERTCVSESRETGIWLRRVQRSVTDTKRRRRRGTAGKQRTCSKPPAGANLTLAIATTDGVDGGRVGSYGKGKGVMTGPDIRGGQLFGLQMGSGSGFANTEGGDVALEEDEAYAGKQKGKLPP
ncbi:unnamed protein product [Brassica oleracea]